jgi:hypothetical protein
VVRIYSGADLQWCGFTVVRISMDSILAPYSTTHCTVQRYLVHSTLTSEIKIYEKVMMHRPRKNHVVLKKMSTLHLSIDSQKTSPVFLTTFVVKRF